MHTLPLAPLPCETSQESLALQRIDEVGFVDEQMVSQVIARGAYERTHAEPSGMVLSSSDDDYAGWSLPIVSPFRATLNTSALTTRLPGKPSLPKCVEPGLDAPYEGGHRWWLFGMSGAMTCCIMALTIYGLAHQDLDPTIPTSSRVVQQPKALPAATGKATPPPSLTTILPAER